MAEYAYEYEVFPRCGRFVGTSFEFRVVVAGETKAKVARMIESSLRVEVERLLLRDGHASEASEGNAPSHAGGCILTARFDVSMDIAGAVSVAEAARILGISRARVFQLLKEGRLEAVSGGCATLVACPSIAGRLQEELSAGSPCKGAAPAPPTNRAVPMLGLLETLQCRAGCACISDLKIPSNLPFVRHALRGIDPDAFGVDEWNDAVRYITGRDMGFSCGGVAAEYLARADLRFEAARRSLGGSRWVEAYARRVRALFRRR